MAPFSAASTGTGECQPSVCRPRPFASSYADVPPVPAMIRPAIPARRARHQGNTGGRHDAKIRGQTGHVSDAMLARYVRDGELFVDNAAGALL